MRILFTKSCEVWIVYRHKLWSVDFTKLDIHVEFESIDLRFAEYISTLVVVEDNIISTFLK